MTSFLNLCIKNNILNLSVQKYKSFWYEIDTNSDHKFAEKDIKNGNLDSWFIWIGKTYLAKSL